MNRKYKRLKTQGVWLFAISLSLGISSCKKEKTTTETVTPEVKENKWVSMSTGQSHTVALGSDGSIWGWGHNATGQLGTGNTNSISTPALLSAERDWKFINTGYGHTVAIKTDGSLWAWGENTSGELGIGTKGTAVNTPTRVGNDTDWKMVLAGGNYTIAIKNNNTLWSWGTHSSGRLGNGQSTGETLTPVQVGAESDWDKIFTGNNWGASFAIKKDGTLYAWGVNQNGMLGNGNTSNQLSPVLVGGSSKYKMVSYGRARGTLAIKTDGTLWAVGRNSRGELGIGNMDTQANWVQVGTDKNWNTVSLFARTVLATKTDGSLWGWGENVYGELGNGKINPSSEVAETILSPVQIAGQSSVADAVVGFNFSVIRKNSNGGILFVAGSDMGAFYSLGKGTGNTKPILSFSGHIYLP
ncbi:hypothetical protein DBR43_01250 [Pedobacter sp. KBW06]|uniref:RCC1 domain-containing protein n=1 Tax=Pedobacter sp. KBW06 TaxID=2153359 RepID=UPI000F5ABFFA|nr:hypothetical protein [Pedobacter sp. KBW06]RQO74061.1 hypothetical protein DBR43_01250 [Pedobacter sp. KBW06]